RGDYRPGGVHRRRRHSADYGALHVGAGTCDFPGSGAVLLGAPPLEERAQAAGASQAGGEEGRVRVGASSTVGVSPSSKSEARNVDLPLACDRWSHWVFLTTDITDGTDGKVTPVRGGLGSSASLSRWGCV